MRTLRVLSVFVLAACGGGDPTNPGGNNNGVQNFTALIDGQAWNAEIPPAAVNPQPGSYVITATRFTGTNNYTFAISLTNITGTGTYPLGVNVMMFGGTVVLSQGTPAGGWSTPLNGAAGQIVITTLTATQMVGTFSFTAEPLLAGTVGTRTVTQGQFDVPLTGTGGVAPANQGNSMTANIGGSAYVASGVATVLPAGATPTLTIVAQSLLPNNIGRSLTFSLASMTGTGTYALSTSAPLRTIGVGGAPGNQNAVWASGLTGGGGSVVLTVTAQRIAGTFTGTVIGAGGGVTGPMTISGSFSLARP